MNISLVSMHKRQSTHLTDFMLENNNCYYNLSKYLGLEHLITDCLYSVTKITSSLTYWIF